MAQKTSSETNGSNFFALPPELRLQVYEDFFFKMLMPRRREIQEKTSQSVGECCNFVTPLLLVSKQICEEVLDSLRKQKSYVYRITWQNAGFNCLAKSCIRARKIRVGEYAGTPDLRVEIYPPHPDRRWNMMKISLKIHDLCTKLRAVDQLPQLSVIFKENRTASWSYDQEPSRLMGCWRLWNDYFDVEFTLYLFAALKNVTKAAIELPGSVPLNYPTSDRKYSTIQELKVRHEQSMMNISLLNEGDVTYLFATVGLLARWSKMRP